MGDGERSAAVDGEPRPVGLERLREEGADAADRGAGDGEADLVLDGQRLQALAGAALAEIELNGVHPGARTRRERVAHAGQEVAPHVGEHEVETALGEGLREGEADPLAGASDEGDGAVLLREAGAHRPGSTSKREV
jgi:hypothetical protein